MGTQLRDLDKTPTQQGALVSDEGKFHSRGGDVGVEVDSEVRFRMLNRKRGKSL